MPFRLHCSKSLLFKSIYPLDRSSDTDGQLYKKSAYSIEDHSFSFGCWGAEMPAKYKDQWLNFTAL